MKKKEAMTKGHKDEDKSLMGKKKPARMRGSNRKGARKKLKTKIDDTLEVLEIRAGRAP